MHDLTTNEAINWEKYEYLWRTLPSGDVGELHLFLCVSLSVLATFLNLCFFLCVFLSISSLHPILINFSTSVSLFYHSSHRSTVFNNPFDHGVLRNLTRFWLHQRKGPRRYTIQGAAIDSSA